MKQELDILGYIQFDHHVWLNELLFSHKEVKIYESRLLELMKEISDKATINELSDLYDDFNKRNKEIEKLMQKIRKHVVKNNRLVQSNGNLKSMVDSLHSNTRKEMEKFRNDYTQLKKRFSRFAILHDRFF